MIAHHEFQAGIWLTGVGVLGALGATFFDRISDLTHLMQFVVVSLQLFTVLVSAAVAVIGWRKVWRHRNDE